MPWTKSGDNAASYPPLLRVDSDPAAEDWTLNEVAGFAFRCYLQSAAHMTDYVVEYSTAKLLGNGRHEELIGFATRAGLMTLQSGRGRQRVWKLLADPEFVHLQLRAEVESNRKRDRDRKNADLVMPARRRDGDQCRVCGVVVDWAQRTGPRSATMDHVLGIQAETTVETYVVMCRPCNSSLKGDPHAAVVLDPPTVPVYASKTLALLLGYGYTVDDLPTHTILDPDTASATPIQGSRAKTRPGADTASATPTQGSRAKTRPAVEEEPFLRIPQESRVDSRSGRDGPGRAGPGQDGSGRAGPGQDGSGRRPRPAPAVPRRRGRRARGGQP